MYTQKGCEKKKLCQKIGVKKENFFLKKVGVKKENFSKNVCKVKTFFQLWLCQEKKLYVLDLSHMKAAGQ